MMVEVCQMVVRWCMMVQGGYTGKGCQMVKMVYDGRSVSDGCQMVYDGRSVSDGCQMVYTYDGVGRT
jgi:hypothetical protein